MHLPRICNIIRNTVFLVVGSASAFSWQLDHWTEQICRRKRVCRLSVLEEWQRWTHKIFGKPTNIPPQSSWSRSEITAYWINAYNAYDLLLILSIILCVPSKKLWWQNTKINSVWDFNFIPWNGRTINLNKLNITFGKISGSASMPVWYVLILALSWDRGLCRSWFGYWDGWCLPEIFKDPNKKSVWTFRVVIIWWFLNGTLLISEELKVWKIYQKNMFPKFSSSKTKMKYLDYNWALNDSKSIKQP